MNRLFSAITLALLSGFGSSVKEGIRHLPEDKIVGGSLVRDIKLQPYMVSVNVNIRNDWWFVCGGSLISPVFVVTACQCLIRSRNSTEPSFSLKLPMSKWLFVAGTVRLEQFDQTYQARHPKSLRRHPKCAEAKTVKYDVGIGKMAKPFATTEHVRPVDILSYRSQNFEQQLTNLRSLPHKCTVSGWGVITNEPGQTEFPDLSAKSNQLKTFNVSIMDTKSCWAHIRRLDADETADEDDAHLEAHRQICISSHSTKGTCPGDSGSPLICNGYLVAVVSKSPQCGSAAPQTCQKLSVLLGWIGNELCADGNKCGGPEEPVLRVTSQAEQHLSTLQMAFQFIICNLIIQEV